MITFAIVMGTLGICTMAVDALLNALGRREEMKHLRATNGKLSQENLELRNRVEMLEARVKSKQYTVDIVKQTQIDDLQAENRRLRTLLDQKWEDANREM